MMLNFLPILSVVNARWCPTWISAMLALLSVELEKGTSHRHSMRRLFLFMLYKALKRGLISLIEFQTRLGQKSFFLCVIVQL